MKKIELKGINYIEPLNGSSTWYFGTDYIHGDLYEAEEVFKSDEPIKSNRLVFVKYPEGIIVEPIKARDGQYFGRPLYYDGKIHILLVDFEKELIFIYNYEDITSELDQIVSIPLSKVVDCYNLMLNCKPLMLTRSAHDGIFQIIYPESVDIAIGDGEIFEWRDGDRLYFSRWREGEDGEEIVEAVVRKYPKGELIEILSGYLMSMPDGQIWIIG